MLDARKCIFELEKYNFSKQKVQFGEEVEWLISKESNKGWMQKPSKWQFSADFYVAQD